MTLKHSTQPTLKHINYAVAELGVSAVESFLRLFLLIYLTDKIGVSPQQAGYAVAIGILWDAFADPFMGQISDRTQTRFGKRIPWMIVGTPLLAISFVLLFLLEPLKQLPPLQIFCIVTVINICINTAMTMISIPHLALGQDISNSSQERTTIYAWRSFMALLGLLIGVLVPSVFKLWAVALNSPETTFAVIISFVLVISSLITIFTSRKYIEPNHRQLSKSADTDQPPKPSHFFSVFKFLNGPLAVINLSFFLATFAQGLNSVVAMYYYRYTLQMNEQELGGILIVFIACLALTLPFWVILSRNYSKVYLIAFGIITLGILTSIVYPLLPPQSYIGPVAMAIVGGMLLGCTGLLESMLVDIALKQGLHENQMGQVFGVWKFIAKSSRGIAIAAGGYLLYIAGYESKNIVDGQTSTIEPDVAINIALLFGPAVGVFFVIAGLVLLRTKKYQV